MQVFAPGHADHHGRAVPCRWPIPPHQQKGPPVTAGEYTAPTGQAGRLSSVRVRLLVLVLFPLLGLVALAGVQAGISLAATADAARGVVMADAATATAGLMHQLEREQAETTALRDRGGRSGAALVFAQRARTDAALRRYRQALEVALRMASQLRAGYRSADRQLARLAAARTAALSRPTGDPTAGWDQPYRAITAALVQVGRALPQQLTDQRLAGQERAIAEVTAAAYAVAQQRDLLRSVLTRGRYPPADRARFAALLTLQGERRQAFLAAADPAAAATWEHLVRGTDVDIMTRIQDAALAGERRLLAFDPDAWHVAATHAIRLIHEVELTLADRLHETAIGRHAGAQRAATAVLGGSGAVALGSVTIAVVLVTRIGRRLRRLRDAALAVARNELPAAIDAVSRATDPVSVHKQQLAAAQQIDAAVANGPADEITQVGYSFGAVHRRALQLAAEQALQRLDTAALFVTLARRNQTLVQRQLRAIDDLERDEADPDRLSMFYTVDHLAARMRRNNENLLVLGGSDPGRRFSAAQSLFDVVRGAAAEIAEYVRVDPVELAPVAIVGHAVGDVVHLLAELLENATRYSGPDTQVRVTAREGAHGTMLTIYDHGIGMAQSDLAYANHRLTRRADLTASLAGTMGLSVVARLAARHGVDVQLRSRLGGGTTALVNLPRPLVVPWRPGGTDQPLRPPDSARRAISAAPAVVSQPPPGSVAIAASPGTQTLLTAAIYEELASAWFRPPEPGGDGRAWASPGDHVRQQVARALAEDADRDGTATGLPRRTPGARLLPGSVPVAESTGVRIDPDRVRSRLAGLGRAVIAAERDGRTR